MEYNNKLFSEDLLKGRGIYTAPENYDHDTQIDTFGEKVRILDSTRLYSEELTSRNFGKTTNKLEPGKTYRIKMFQALTSSPPGYLYYGGNECLAFLESNNAILVGAQGLTALQAGQPELFPKGKCIVSFDRYDALWCCKKVGLVTVPCVRQDSDDSWNFFLSLFDIPFSPSLVLLCFCDMDEVV